MHVFLKKHIYLKKINSGKYKIISYAKTNIVLILITKFYKNNPIIIQKLHNIYYVSFIFTCDNLIQSEKYINIFLNDYVCNKTNDYISFCLLERFFPNNKTLFIFKDKILPITFFDYENIIDLY